MRGIRADKPSATTFVVKLVDFVVIACRSFYLLPKSAFLSGFVHCSMPSTVMWFHAVQISCCHMPIVATRTKNHDCITLMSFSMRVL